jgi:hypothetical protein
LPVGRHPEVGNGGEGVDRVALCAATHVRCIQ